MAMTFGNFVLGEKIGEGGMGAVYRAEHPVLREPAVVKRLLPEYTANPDVVARFLNEARAARRLIHPNIVKVHDCGQASTGEWYIALEYLDGVPLSTWLAGKTSAGVGPLKPGQGLAVSPVQIVRILIQVARALRFAHEFRADDVAGIVHRDV